MDEKDKLIETLQKRISELEEQNKKLLNKITELHMSIVKIEEERFK